MSSKLTTKASQIARATQLIAGTKKHLASATSLTLKSVAYTPTQILTAFQTLIDLYSAVDAANAVAKVKLTAEKAQAPALRSLMAALVAYVRLTFSASPDVLADFGIAPKKVPTPLTTAQQAVAVAKRDATRKARGTTGPKAKKAVKGDVVSVVVTPVKAGPPVVTSSNPTSAPVNSTGSAPAGSTSHGA